MERILCYLIITLQLLSFSLADTLTCYKPNGDPFTTEDVGKKCNSVDGSTSMCCGKNDTCLANGLCKIEGDDYNDPIYWRDSCSDENWPTESCLWACVVSST